MIYPALCFGCLLSIVVQDSRPTTLARAFLQLQGKLESPRLGGLRQPHHQRIELLEAFLTEHATTNNQASHLVLLQARIRLAGLYLSNFDLDQAKQQFTVVLKQVSPQDKDLRPRALYGLGQVQELDGQLDDATNTLRRIIRSYEGTRYATFAKVSLQRIQAKDLAVIGKLAPAIRPHLDLTGKARDLSSLLGEPVLLLFWSPDHLAGLAQINKLLLAAKKADLATRQVLSFGMHADSDQLRVRIEAEGWKIPVIPLNQEFLDPLVIKYGLRSIPSSFLIGPDGTLLARNLSPTRLTAALRALR